MLISFLSYAGIDQHKIDSLKNQFAVNKTDTAHIRLNLFLSKAYKSSGINRYDSAFHFLNKALKLSQELKYDKWLYAIYSQNSDLLYSSGNFSIALEYYFKMLKLLDETKLIVENNIPWKIKYINLYSQIGTSYFSLNNEDKALTYYNKSLELCRKINSIDKNYPLADLQLRLYNNIGSVYLMHKNLENARTNYEKALALNKKINNQLAYGSIYNNLGIIYNSQKDYPKAFEYYNKSLEIRKGLKDSAGIAQVYNNLGDCYFQTGDFTKSVETLKKALFFSQRAANLPSQIKAADFLSRTYEMSGDYRKALESQRLANKLNDSIKNSGQIETASRLELQYLFEKQQKENELLQQIELAKKQQKVLLLMIFSGVLLFSFIVLMLLNRNQKIKIRQNKLIEDSLKLESKNLLLEKQNLELEKGNLKQELDFRNKELATHVMYLLKKNEFISSISEKLLNIKSLLNNEDKKWVQDIVREMESNIDNTVWGEFEMRFQQVHEEFYARLKEHYPDLTPNEKKICAFLLLNMTTKDISSITFQSVKSIQVARTRLRKKMGMTRDENLIAYLQQL